MKIYFCITLLLLCTCTTSIQSQGAAKDTAYYVHPINASHVCGGIEFCYTLEEYAENTTKFFSEGVKYLHFFEGHHVADELLINNSTGISILHVGNSPTNSCAVSIKCDITAKMAASVHTSVIFRDICLEGAVEVIGNQVIASDTTFSSPAESASSKGSASFSIYSECSDIRLVGSSFNGVSVNITLGLCGTRNSTRNSIQMENCVMDGMSSVKRDLVNLTLLEASVDIDNCEVKDGKGTGLRAQLDRSVLTVTNSSIVDNENSGIYIVTLNNGNDVVIENTYIAGNRLRDMNNGNPYRWNVPNGAGLSACPGEQSIASQQTYSITVKNTHVENNHDLNGVPKIVFIYVPDNATIIDSQFLSNNGSAVAVFLTDYFTIAGNTNFIRNFGFEGGALLLHATYLTITDNSNITFQENHASNVGGAIHVVGIPIQIDERQRCFYQLQSPNPYVALNFINNMADKGGSHIYGATTKSPCSATNSAELVVEHGDHPNVFHFDPSFNQTLSCVSSDPTRVCLCDENSTKHCADMDYVFNKKSCYPGETLTLSAVVVGSDFGAVDGSVHATISENSALSDLQHAQRVHSIKCEDLSYTIHAEPGNRTQVILYKDSSLSNEWYQNRTIAKKYIDKYNEEDVIDINLLSIPLYIDIDVMECPAGFVLQDKICVCDSRLQIDEKVQCYIQGGQIYITRTSTLWVSSGFNASTVTFSTKCPKSRCKDETVSLNIQQNPDTQCLSHRTGTICGQCEKGYSLALGSLECIECPTNNIYLLLIVPFAVAGILLVLFIKFLDLTVADGYINGLIFYCNIVWVNKNILLPVDIKGTGFLRIFLAWFNLDLGIETCFFDGLDMYAYTWIQYIFIIYVLTISFLVVLIGRRVNLLGRNAPQVLATLFLLCYYKLLNNMFLSLRVSTVTEIDTTGKSHRTLVWEADGNVLYWRDKHILLFIVAVLLLVFIYIPYTFILLFLRLLNRSKHRIVIRLLLTLKPLTDAYAGPFKQKREYWVGILLLVRVFLLLISSVTYGIYSIFNNMALIVIISGLILYKSQTGHLYKNRCLSLMENLLFFNLIVLAGTYYLSEYKTFHDAVAFSMVALAFFQFLVLVMKNAALIIARKCCQSHSAYEATPLVERSITIEHPAHSAITTTNVFMEWLDVGRNNEEEHPPENKQT